MVKQAVFASDKRHDDSTYEAFWMSVAAQARTLYLWVRALCFWLAEPRHFWLATVVVVLALLFALRRGVTEPEVRYAGLLLQILGVGTVALGIRETRALFSLPTLAGWFRDWLSRRPLYGGRVVFGSANITGGGASMTGRGYGSVSAADASVEARIEALERNVKLINERIDHTQKEVDEKFRNHADLLKQEEQARAKEDQAIREKLAAAQTGGLNISAMGAFWIFVGITLSTASPEITKYLN